MRGLCLGEIPRPLAVVVLTALVQGLVFYVVYAGATKFGSPGTDTSVLDGLAAAIFSVPALAFAVSYMDVAKVDPQACAAGAANLIAAGAAVSTYFADPLLSSGRLSAMAFAFFVASFFLGTE